MRYVALLRGVNVGGKNPIRMTELRSVFERIGFANVATYIHSGNVVFDSSERVTAGIAQEIEGALWSTFGVDTCVVLRTQRQLEKVLAAVPPEWKAPNDLRMYIAFIREPATPQDVLAEVEPKEGVDSVDAGSGVLYLSTELSGLTKSGFTKLVGKPTYRSITIRNYRTAQKLLAFSKNP